MCERLGCESQQRDERFFKQVATRVPGSFVEVTEEFLVAGLSLLGGKYWTVGAAVAFQP